MRELGLSLTPPPPVDFDSVPLERLLPVRTPRAGGFTGTLASHQVQCRGTVCLRVPQLAVPRNGCGM